MITAGALVLLAGCRGDDGDGGAKATAADARPAQVSLALADGSADVSPAVPLEISVTDGELGEVTLVDEAGAEGPGAVAAGGPPRGPGGEPENPPGLRTPDKTTPPAGEKGEPEDEAAAYIPTPHPT